MNAFHVRQRRQKSIYPRMEEQYENRIRHQEWWMVAGKRIHPRTMSFSFFPRRHSLSFCVSLSIVRAALAALAFSLQFRATYIDACRNLSPLTVRKRINTWGCRKMFPSRCVSQLRPLRSSILRHSTISWVLFDKSKESSCYGLILDGNDDQWLVITRRDWSMHWIEFSVFCFPRELCTLTIM